ncbi:MAG: glycosyltransferase family 2 protein [Rhabdochlamydiaceae bacterium]
MNKKLPELSIFFPFWNEEKNIAAVVTKAALVAKEVAQKWEIIMVNDGSSDNTLGVAEELQKKDPTHLSVVSHSPNRGYGASLKEGFTYAKYNYIVFTDGDGQFNFDEVKKFIPLIDSADIVIGYRKKRRDHKIFKRLLLMNLLKIGDLILFGFNFKDIDCGFKMFTRHAIDEIMPLRSEGAMITTEILAKATKKKLRIKQVGVEHYQRQYGIQTGANMAVILRAILESFTLWLDIKNGRF